MIVCAGRNETFPFATPIGVGLIESAMNLTRLCLFDKPDYILFIGSAGSYTNSVYNIFDIVESSSASNIELSFFNDDSYTPIDNVLRCEDVKFKSDTIVNSSNYITTNEKFGKDFKQNNIGIENMEFYSVVKIAQEFDIDVKGIFVVTNYTNKNAHKDFISNHKEAMDKLIKYLEEKKIIVPRGTKG
ncbi:MAG: purine-nucleoside phosphorylase [Epsilonproteobacteria bacterium]|nr:MAG: purine-nucleoside phosphorylase [Campylobacterota bacterium]